MKRIYYFLSLLLCVFVFTLPVSAGEKYKSLRGGSDIPADSTPPVGMDWKDGDSTIARTFIHQPPLIPHDSAEYNIATSANDCLDCHGEPDSGAPLPYASHYLDRDGKRSETVSSLWYFCTQCHVGQVDAKPLVENTFQAKISAGERYKSLRGDFDIPAGSTTPVGMDWKAEESTTARTFIHQPPLIPHAIAEYNISTSANDCLDCHGDKDSGTPRPHDSHYLDRDGKRSDSVSSRWYFCTQCHVGQVDAKPLVENIFSTAK